MAATNDSWIQTFIDLWAKYMDQYFSMVHFSVWGNDFWWGILWLPVSQAEKEPVEIVISWSNSKIYCASQVRGFYWNSQRWDSRIWPLDQKTHDWLTWNDTTWKYKGLVMTWGWYTTCSESSEGAQELINAMNWEITQATFSDSFWIYWSIWHYYSWASSEPMYLVAGVSYNSERNAMITWNDAKLTCSLQRLNNSYPFGYSK